MKRRQLMQGAAVGALSLGLSACNSKSSSNNVTSSAGADCKGEESWRWKMVTTWPKDFPGMGTGAARLAEWVNKMSGGRLTITVYGNNELVSAFEAFDVVSRGTVEMAHGAAYYWKGKALAAQYFGGVPFGMNANELSGWLYYGGGLELWREVYRPFGVVPFPAGNTGVQMGGWFNREIHSVDDLRGLKMRIPGLGGEVLQKVGGLAVNIPGAEIFTALKTGTIDATEWVGPWNDLSFGLHQAAKFYYTPGWHEPGTTLELIVNEQALASLPADLQEIVRVGCQAINADMHAEYNLRNQSALKSLVEEHGVELREFPAEVIAALRQASQEVLQELAASDAQCAKVYESYRNYQTQAQWWTAHSEQSYLRLRDQGAS